MKCLVAIFGFLAIATAKPSHIADYSYSTGAFHTPLISSPIVTYNSLPALSHHAFAYKTLPHLAYNKEIASSVVGHETSISHQDSTVQHGSTIVQEVAPSVEVKTIHTAPVIHDIPQLLAYNSAPVISHSVITHNIEPHVKKIEMATPEIQHEAVEIHDTTVKHEAAPAVEVKSISAVKDDTIVVHEAPLVKTEIAAPIHSEAKVSHIAHPTAYTSFIHHATPIIAYKSAIDHPILSHAALATHKLAIHPTAYSVAFGVPGSIATHVAVDKTQYHAQDIVGQTNYGHSEPLQHHHASQDAAGNKFGSFGWVAPNGQIVGGDYVADALGYRVSSNAIPVGPAPVLDTPEVVAARSAHFAAHAAARAHHYI